MKVHLNNRHNNNNNNSNNMKEAERRLGTILKTAQKLSVSPEDLSGLASVKKLTQGSSRCRSYGRHVLPLVAGLLTILMVLFVYSVEEQGLGCLKNTSESSVTTAKEATTPGSTKPAATPGQDNSDETHQSEPVSSSRSERWVTSTGQLLRRER